MENNKGITMVALILTIIVMAILAGITINTGSKVIKDAELQDVVTNMLLIQAKVKIGIEEGNFKTANLNSEDENEKEKIKDTYLLGKIAETQQYSEYIREELRGKKWRLISDDDLKNMGLNELANVNGEENYYLYTYDEIDGDFEIEIVYTGGYKHSDGKIYYVLSDLIELQQN